MKVENGPLLNLQEIGLRKIGADGNIRVASSRRGVFRRQIVGQLSFVCEERRQGTAAMQGKCPGCGAAPNILIVPFRARDEIAKRTVPALQFICDQCQIILSVALDPEWQAQIVAGQLRTVGEGSETQQ